MATRVNLATVRRAGEAIDPGWSPRKWMLTGAWFFIIASAFQLVWAVGVLATEGGYATIYSLTTDGRTYNGFGLSYIAWPGLIFAGVQLAGLVTATVCSTLPYPRARRFGHLYLTGWAGLYLINVYWIASHDSTILFPGLAAFMTVLFICTLYRGFGHRFRRRKSPAPPPEAESIASMEAPQQSNAIDAHTSIAQDTTPRTWFERFSHRARLWFTAAQPHAAKAWKETWRWTRARTKEAHASLRSLIAKWKSRGGHRATRSPSTPSVSRDSQSVA